MGKALADNQAHPPQAQTWRQWLGLDPIPSQGGAGSPAGGKAATGRTAGGSSAPGAGNVPVDTGGATIPGFTPEETQSYLNILGKRESGNTYMGNNAQGYGGRWQMGAGEVAGTGVCAGRELVQNVGGAQDASMMKYTLQHYNQLVEAGVIRPGMSHQEVAGYLAAAHLGGVGGAIALSKGQARSDANGTPTSEYFRMMSGLGGGAGTADAGGAYKDFGTLYKAGQTFGHTITGATDKGAFVDGQWIPFWAHLPGSPDNAGQRAASGGASASDVQKDNAAGADQIKKWESKPSPWGTLHDYWNGVPGAGVGVPGGNAPLSSLQNNSPVTTSSTANTQHIGAINVNVTPDVDPHGMSRTIQDALNRYGFAMMAQSGQN